MLEEFKKKSRRKCHNVAVRCNKLTTRHMINSIHGDYLGCQAENATIWYLKRVATRSTYLIGGFYQLTVYQEIHYRI